jgi:hypothetical protein
VPVIGFLTALGGSGMQALIRWRREKRCHRLLELQRLHLPQHPDQHPLEDAILFAAG